MYKNKSRAQNKKEKIKDNKIIQVKTGVFVQQCCLLSISLSAVNKACCIIYMGDLIKLIEQILFSIYIYLCIMICFSYKISVCVSNNSHSLWGQHKVFSPNFCFFWFFFKKTWKFENSMCVNKTKRKQIITWCYLKSRRVEVDI